MMRVAFCGSFLVLASMLGVPGTLAQEPAAKPPPVSPTNNVLWAHHHDSDTVETTGWLNTLKIDPGSNDIAIGAGQLAGTRVLTLTSTPANVGDTELDPAGNIVITAYIGGSTAQGAVRVSTELTYGGEDLASGAAQNLVLEEAGEGQYGVVTWTVAPDLTTLPAGGQFVWTVSMTGIGTAAFLGVTDERGHSNVVLPVASTTAPEPVTGPVANFHNLTGLDVNITHSFATAENSTHIYNWTSNLTEAQVDVTGDAGSGNFSVTIVDSAGNELLNATTLPRHETLGNLVAGNWTINVTFDAFVGNLTIFIGEPGSSPAVPPSLPGTGNETDDGNVTKKKDKGSPALAPLWLALALAGMAALVRRRQA